MSVNALIIRVAWYFLIEQLHFSVMDVCLRLVCGVLFITFALYVYFVYLVNFRTDTAVGENRDISPTDKKNK